MRFYNREHRSYGGIDRHARSMHLGALDPGGTVVVDRHLPRRPASLLRALAPFRDGLGGAAECMLAW